MSRLIGLTTTVVPEAGHFERPQIALYTAYLAVLERMDLTPVLLTPAHSLDSIERLLSRCCGLVLTGGEDIDPSRYGEEPIPELGLVSPARDAIELCAVRTAMDHRLPILGICRGCQLLNVALGGTLYQDIDVQRPREQGLLHDQVEPWGHRTHYAQVEPDSLLRSIVGTDELFINSYHHQAVREPGKGLRVVACSEDGLIEAIEHVERRWVLGIQWHPERHEATAQETDPDLRIFAAFRDAVTERAEAA